jgi:eukaryotic-like serine/threonine-protein kinase
MSEDIEQLKRAFSAYRVEQQIGSGGMANVYLARDHKHDRKVAIKVLHAELAAVLGVTRFVQEIRVTANLQHPHILGLIDSGVLPDTADELRGRPYYVMPFVEGESLRERLDRERQLPVAEAIRIATQVGSALDYAHRHGVIHRDIKPENILLTDDTAIVADFGIALAVTLAAGPRITQTGLSVGTPNYMSPEQALAEKTITARSDIYSLGAVTYEMLVGEPPFTGPTVQAILARVMTEDPRSLTTQRRSVPPSAAAAVSRALEKLPADRFATAHEFAAALSGPSFVRSSENASGYSLRWNKLPLYVSSGLALVFLATTVWAWRRDDRPKSAVRYNLDLDASEKIVRGAVGWGRLAISRDGSRLAYVGGPSEQVLIRSRDQLHADPLPHSEKAVTPFFSPDGRQVGFVKGTLLQIAPVNGGPPATVTDSLVGTGGMSWGRDGMIYADCSADAGLVRVEAKAGAIPRRFTTLDSANGETDHNWPEVLPNGKGVLFTTTVHSNRNDKGASQFAVAVAEISSGKHRLVIRGATSPRYIAGYLLYLTADKTLMAVPFDEDSMKITGDPMVIVSGIRLDHWGGADFAVSATGTLVYVAATDEGKHELVWVTRDGKAQSLDANWLADFWNPVLSPDGKQLAVAETGDDGGWQVWTRRFGGGSPARLSFEGSVNWYPTWTGDGQSVTYNSNVGGSFALWTKRADGSSAAVRDLHQDRGSLEPVWSPDAKWLVFETETSSQGAGDIVGIRPGIDREAVPLVASEFTEVAPAFSPDGRWLAYASNETGRFEIYVVPFPNTKSAKWVVSNGGGTEPLWSHRGNELFYRSAAGNLVAVAVTTSPTFSVGRSTSLFSATQYRAYPQGLEYAVSPDDRRFLMVRPVATDSSQKLTVVDNWYEELKAKARARADR